MSRYLVDHVAARPNVAVLTEAIVTALEGQSGVLEAIRCRSGRPLEEVRGAVRHLFLFTGATPNYRMVVPVGRRARRQGL